MNPKTKLFRALTFIATAAFLPAILPALAQAPEAAQEGLEQIKAELKEKLQAPDVSEALNEPDGAAFNLTENGGWQLFGLGTGDYDFNDPGDIMDATNEALLKAKANLSKFISEKLDSEQLLNSLTTKTKHLSRGSGGENPSVSRESVKTIIEKIKNSSNEILSGIVVLSTDKKPSGENAGIVQVKVGISSKSLAAAEKIAGAITQSFKNRSGDSQSGATSGSQSGSQSAAPNTRETKRSTSDF